MILIRSFKHRDMYVCKAFGRRYHPQNTLHTNNGGKQRDTI